MSTDIPFVDLCANPACRNYVQMGMDPDTHRLFYKCDACQTCTPVGNDVANLCVRLSSNVGAHQALNTLPLILNPYLVHDRTLERITRHCDQCRETRVCIMLQANYEQMRYYAVCETCMHAHDNVRAAAV